jgi:RNA polymerase sigma-70 factor (ECF subfamily)
MLPLEQKYEEAQLLTMLAKNSEFAFQLIFNRYRDTVYRSAMVWLKSPILAEEIVQDVFMKLWLQRDRLTGLRSLESWIFAVAKNQMLNGLKRTSHEWRIREYWEKEELHIGNDTDYRVRHNELKELIVKAIDNLPAQQRMIYKMCREKGLSYEAIGKELTISSLTVKTHMARALRSIREYLKQHGDALILFLIITTFR